MGRRLSIGILVLTALYAAQTDLTSVQELIDLVRAANQKHTPDKPLAKSLRKLILGEKLTLRTIEELESEGAGPETVAALDFLLDNSTGRPPSIAVSTFPSAPRPSIEEQKSFFRRVDVNAIHYTRSLPDFICTEVVHRSRLLHNPGNRGGGANAPVVWSPVDVLTVKLTYFENHERYDLTLVNGKKTQLAYESTGGAISEGDFGSTLSEIFAPESETKFQWDHWTHLRKHLTQVYSYRTSREKSHYRIGVGHHPSNRSFVVAGRRGFVYADNDTGMVMRITGEAESIPEGFPVTAQASMLDYDYAEVGGRKFLLPLRGESRIITARVSFKNVVEFREYRKFTGESSISFDLPDSTPEPEKKP